MEFDVDQPAVESIFDVPDSEGRFSPARLAYLQAMGKRRPAVFLAFPPKAAGTYLRQAIIEETGGDLIRVVHAQGGRDGQLYLPTFIAYYCGGVCPGPLVAHVHLLALGANIRLLEAFGLKPVVMVRSIPDMLASYWDMLDREPASLQHGLNCAIPESWPSMSRGRKADFLADMVAPWYVNFFAGWFAYAAQKDSPALLVRYGDFLKDPASVLEKILAHSGLPAGRQDCERALEEVWPNRAGLRFNRGVAGRGRDYFDPPHLKALERMLSYYPALAGHASELLALEPAV